MNRKISISFYIDDNSIKLDTGSQGDISPEEHKKMINFLNNNKELKRQLWQAFDEFKDICKTSPPKVKPKKKYPIKRYGFNVYKGGKQI